jgi:hypothetical protein
MSPFGDYSPLSAALVCRGNADKCFTVRDANGLQLTWVDYESEPGRQSAAAEQDDARRIAANIAKMPGLLANRQDV